MFLLGGFGRNKSFFEYNPFKYVMSILPMLLAAGVSYGLNKLDKNEGTDPSIQTASSMSPGQTALSQKLGPYLTGQIGKSLPGYEGQSVAGLTPEELAGMSRIRSLTGEPIQGLESAYQRYLTGDPTTQINPETTENFFRKSIYDPSLRDFREDVLPGIEEAYVGPGTYWGSARADAVREASEGFASDMAGKRAELAYADEQSRRSLSESAADRALNAGQLSTQYGAYDLAKQQAILQTEALPRMLEQAQLDWDYNEYLRTAPENSPYMSMALQYLGVPMTYGMGMQGQAETPGVLAGLASTFAGSYAQATAGNMASAK